MELLSEETRVILTLEVECFQPCECWMQGHVGRALFIFSHAPHAPVKPSFQGCALAVLTAGSTKPELLELEAARASLKGICFSFLPFSLFWMDEHGKVVISCGYILYTIMPLVWIIIFSPRKADTACWYFLLVCLGFFFVFFLPHHNAVWVTGTRLPLKSLQIPKLHIPSAQDNIHVCYDSCELANILVLFCKF